jgi:putative zinc finger/helix-turn-helix YgiT family protein
MNCPNCVKANLRKQKARIPGETKGERFSISMEGLVCPKCGWTTVEGRDLAEYMRRLADAYRARHGLLTSDELRTRRSRLGMTQEEFARYVGVGVASIRRWEMGKVQDASSDELIKLRTDEEEARLNLDRVRFMHSAAPEHSHASGADTQAWSIPSWVVSSSLNLYWQSESSPVKADNGERRIQVPVQVPASGVTGGAAPYSPRGAP